MNCEFSIPGLNSLSLYFSGLTGRGRGWPKVYLHVNKIQNLSPRRRLEPGFSNEHENGFLLSLRPAAPLQPTAVLLIPDCSLPGTCTRFAFAQLVRRTGLFSAAPVGAGLRPPLALRSSRLHFRERHGDAEESGDPRPAGTGPVIG